MVVSCELLLTSRNKYMLCSVLFCDQLFIKMTTFLTALDEYGEPCHSSMYKDLWTNAPKEISLEYPDYPFEQHFRKPIPSYPPVSAIRDYLEGVYIGHVAITVKPVNKDHPKERQQKVYLEKWSFFGGFFVLFNQ